MTALTPLVAAHSDPVESIDGTGLDLEDDTNLSVASRGGISAGLDAGREVATLLVEVLEPALRAEASLPAV